jgi:hypothetical protein
MSLGEADSPKLLLYYPTILLGKLTNQQDKQQPSSQTTIRSKDRARIVNIHLLNIDTFYANHPPRC